MVKLSVMSLSDKVRLMVKPDDNTTRLLTLEDVRLYGELNGDDFTYESGACDYYLRSKLGFEREFGSIAATREVDNVQAVLDINNGVVSVHYEIGGVPYYFVGRGVVYEEV